MAGAGTSAVGTTLYDKQVATGSSISKIATRDIHGKLRFVKVIHTVGASSGTGTAGAMVDTDEINLFKLPPNARLLLNMSYVKFSADQGATTTIDIGNRLYRDRGGDDVAEDQDSVINGWDAATTALEAIPTSTVAFGTNVDTMQTITFDSQEPVTLYMTCMDAGGTFDGDVGDTYEFFFVYVTD